MSVPNACQHLNFEPFKSESLAHPGAVNGFEFILGTCLDCRVNLLKVYVEATGQDVRLALDPDDYEALWGAESSAARLGLANDLWINHLSTL